VWTLTRQDADEFCREEALIAASECPAGRLVAVSKDDGQDLEEEFSPEVVVLQDPQKDVSAALAVRGPVQLVSANGEEYEVRNRVALCRCGQSSNKPYCDASHVSAGYTDGR
jgi:CDGSH-type Zn-finger protein